MDQQVSEDAVMRAVLAAVDAEDPIQVSSAQPTTRNVSRQAQPSEGAGPALPTRRATTESFADKFRARGRREKLAPKGDAWEVTGSSVPAALAAARDGLGSVEVLSGYRSRSLWGRPRVTLTVRQTRSLDSPARVDGGSTGTGNAARTWQADWSRRALRSLGVPDQTLGHLPLEDPETVTQWEEAVERAVSRTLESAPPPDSDVLLVGRGARGAAACLRAAAVGLPAGFLVLDDGSGPASPSRVVRALREAMPPLTSSAGVSPRVLTETQTPTIVAEGGTAEHGRTATDGAGAAIGQYGARHEGRSADSASGAPRKQKTARETGQKESPARKTPRAKAGTAPETPTTKPSRARKPTQTTKAARPPAKSKAVAGRNDSMSQGKGQVADAQERPLPTRADQESPASKASASEPAAKGTQRKKRPAGEVTGG